MQRYANVLGSFFCFLFLLYILLRLYSYNVVEALVAITKQAVSHSMHVEDEKHTVLVLPVQLCGHMFFSFHAPVIYVQRISGPWDVSRMITSEVTIFAHVW